MDDLGSRACLKRGFRRRRFALREPKKSCFRPASPGFPRTIRGLPFLVAHYPRLDIVDIPDPAAGRNRLRSRGPIPRVGQWPCSAQLDFRTRYVCSRKTALRAPRRGETPVFSHHLSENWKSSTLKSTFCDEAPGSATLFHNAPVENAWFEVSRENGVPPKITTTRAPSFTDGRLEFLKE